MKLAVRSSANSNRAILLLGPTGAGKTPLGELMQERGLWRAKCLHFDFGANLREVAGSHPSPFPVGEGAISRRDLEFLRRVLESGTLLENEHFPIAERILRWFMAQHGADRQTRIVLNGLPRHVGQARAIDFILDLEAVVHLECSSETALRRIQANVGGDRTGRVDDDLAAIREKLRIFNQRTAPLLEYYRRRGARIETVEVTAGMTPEQIWEVLDQR